MKQLMLAFSFAIILLATGCGSDEPTGGGGGTDVQTPVLRVQIPGVGTFMVPSVQAQGVFATFNLHGTSAADHRMAHGSEFAIAAFTDGLGLPTVYGGTVSVNGTTIDTALIPPSGGFPAFLFYYWPDPSIPGSTLDSVHFDGSPHSWTIGGSGNVQGFSYSIQSVNGDPSISLPAVLAEVPRNQSLTIQWNGASASDTMLVAVTDNSGTGTTIAALVTGSSHTFSAALLGTLAAGEASVEIEKIRYVLFNVGGRTYMMSSASTDRRAVLLR